jgi:DNA-binding MarR family transcriptional regulator
MCNIVQNYCMCKTLLMPGEQRCHTTWMALPAADRDAWTAFRRAAVEVIAQLDADLQEHAGVGYTDFDALVQLSVAAGGCMRMADLARAVSRSPSALTRLVTRLEKRHLVLRTRLHATGVIVAITARGHALIDDASPRHLELVEKLFWSPLSQNQRLQLSRLTQRLIDSAAQDR